MIRDGRIARLLVKAARAIIVLIASAIFTMVFFLVLPLLEQVNRGASDDLEVREAATADLPPPPPPPPEEPPEQQPEEPPPPEVANEAPPLDLSMLELALNPGAGDGFGDFAMKLTSIDAAMQAEADAIFSSSDLDQQPRPVFQPAPEYPSDLKKKKIEGTVYILFIIDKTGRVQNPIVQKSAHSALEAPALKAVRKWRFEPGRRKGQAVQFRMRVPVSFSAG